MNALLSEIWVEDSTTGLVWRTFSLSASKQAVHSMTTFLVSVF